jgi:Rrf2 family cysteine metabolism transcriptional repressor
MALTKKSIYGLNAMYLLANRTDLISIKEIAKQSNLPQNYLEQILSTLKKAGLAISIRGVNGGYRIAQDPKQITVLEIIKALDGDILDIDRSSSDTVSKFLEHQESIVEEKFDISLQSLKEFDTKEIDFCI